MTSPDLLADPCLKFILKLMYFYIPKSPLFPLFYKGKKTLNKKTQQIILFAKKRELILSEHDYILLSHGNGHKDSVCTDRNNFVSKIG